MRNISRKRKAVSMRKQGKSYGEISKATGASKSTLSYWLKTIPLSETQRKKLYTAKLKNMLKGSNSVRERRKREVDAILESARREIHLPLSEDEIRLFGAAIYWAEGSKGGLMEVTNSDPALILYMVHWIENMFNIPPAELKAKLNIYPQQNDSDIKKFWSSLCGIPLSQFGKSFVKPLSKDYKKNNLYYGTIKIVVPKSTNKKLQVFGWIQGVLKPHLARTNLVQNEWKKLRELEKPVNLN